MLKSVLSILIILVFSVTAMSQSQYENASFEEWEEVGTPYEEPVNWSSLKTSDNPTASDFAPRVMFRSDTTAHSGDYSVYLINTFVPIISSVATGTFCNGRYHVAPDFNPDESSSITVVGDDRWHTQLTQRPDSVVGWYMCKPVDGDFPTVKVVIHQDSCSIPGTEDEWIAEAYWEGPTTEVNTWTRFSIPFVYYKDEIPEFILTIFTAGNGVDAVADGQAWFDDLELIYNPDGIDELSKDDLRVFYTNGTLEMNLVEQQPQLYNLQITDLSGHVVYNDDIKSGIRHRISISLPGGMYIASVSDSKDVLSKKFIVQ